MLQLSPVLAATLGRVPDVRPEDLNGFAVSYLRFSTTAQLLGESQRRQVEASTKFIAEHGFTLLDDIRDRGRSAFKGRHIEGGGLGRFLAATREGIVKRGTLLVIESLDRLTRLKPLDALALFTSILKDGIVIVTLMDGAWYSERTVNKSHGQIQQAVGLLLGAHAESVAKSNRGRDIWANVRRKKAHRNCPPWLTPNPKKPTAYRILKQRAALVKRIFEEFVAGTPVLGIVRLLNGAWNEPCWERTKARTVPGWYHVYVRKLLSNRAVLGEFEIGHLDLDSGKHVRSGVTEMRAKPIIEHALWQRAQARLAQSRPGRVGMARNLLGHRGRCAVCLGTMGWASQTYLRCHAAHRGAKCEHRLMHNYFQIERVIVDEVLKADHIKAGALDEPTGEVEQELVEVRARIATLTDAISRLLDSIEKGGGQDAARRVDRRRAERDEARKLEATLQQQAAQHAQPDHRDALAALRADLTATDRDKRMAARRRARVLLQQMLDAVLFFDNGDVILAQRGGRYLKLIRNRKVVATMAGHVLVDRMMRDAEDARIEPSGAEAGSLEDIRHRAEMLRRATNEDIRSGRRPVDRTRLRRYAAAAAD